jgi:hypothetical protein
MMMPLHCGQREHKPGAASDFQAASSLDRSIPQAPPEGARTLKPTAQRGVARGPMGGRRCHLQPESD